MAGRFTFVVFIALLTAAAARVLPGGDASFSDQKNFLNFGGVGSYGGIGTNGMPFGGVGGAVGNGGLVGGPPLHAVGGFLGTGPNGGLTGVGGVYPGGVGTIGVLGGGAGAGAGGALPHH